MNARRAAPPLLQTAATALALAGVITLPLFGVPDLRGAGAFFGGNSATVSAAAAAAGLCVWALAALIVMLSALEVVRGWLHRPRAARPVTMSLAVLLAAVLLCVAALLQRHARDVLCCADQRWQLTEALHLAG